MRLDHLDACIPESFSSACSNRVGIPVQVNHPAYPGRNERIRTGRRPAGVVAGLKRDDNGMDLVQLLGCMELLEKQRLGVKPACTLMGCGSEQRTLAIEGCSSHRGIGRRGATEGLGGSKGRIDCKFDRLRIHP